MNIKRLGESDLFVSEIGLGCMSLGTDRKIATDIINRAVDLGVTMFDTADLYQQGFNEELVGQALRGLRDRVVIASKVGNRWREDGSGWDWDPRKSYIRKAVELSLKRLGVDTIDLYQLHGGTVLDPIDETIEAFEELKAEGLIRFYGISSIRPNVIREYLKRSNIVTVMMQYSLLDRRPEEQMFDLVAKHGVSVVVRGPVAQGLLAHKQPMPYLAHQLERISAAQLALDEEAAPRQSRSQMALRFASSPPAVTVMVPGASSIAQLEENVSAAAGPSLTEAALDRLRTTVPAEIYKKHR
jgi:aryl-alcohol dehydrogenase-like predicted oxidoreductase